MNQSVLIGLGVLVLIGLFFMFREINCWYFKINERTRLSEEQLEISKKILNELLKLNNMNPVDTK